jgi:ribosomal protein S6--L-glutamate ligase
MKFLIVGAPKTENTQDLVLEIKKRGHGVLVVRPKNFVFSIENKKFLVSALDEDLFDFDVYILRGYNKTLTEVRIFAESLVSQGKVVIDETIGSDYIPSKLYEASKLSREGLNYPKTFLLTDNSRIGEIADKLDFPVIVKPIYGQQGQEIEKIEKKENLTDLFLEKERTEMFLIQEYLKINGDVRVFVVGNQVLGAIKRFIVEGDFRSNASLGAEAEEFPLDDEIKEIALKSTKAMNYEIAGVDLANANGKWYVIEVNSTPQWQKFKEITKINPAEEIIEYAINKHNKK